jgi:hypothetical protein
MNPEARIKAYLDANKGSLRFETIDQIVQQVKLFVFYGASPISDDDVRKIVSRWAIFNPVWLLPQPPLDKPSAPPAAGPTAPTPDSDFIDAVKKAITTVSNGVTIRKGADSIGDCESEARRRSLPLALHGAARLDWRRIPTPFTSPANSQSINGKLR